MYYSPRAHIGLFTLYYMSIQSVPLYHVPMQDPHPSDYSQMPDEYLFSLTLFLIFVLPVITQRAST